MHFASPIPWWLALGLTVLAAASAVYAYAGPIALLSVRRRAVLIGLRCLAFACLLLALAEPVRLAPPAAGDRAVVPVLLDHSRSMAIADVAGGGTRLDQALGLIRDEIAPGLADRFEVELWGFGETLDPLDPAAVRPDGRRSDLAGALDGVQEYYRDRPVAGVVVVTDGGDTGRAGLKPDAGIPLYMVGIGKPAIARDREVLEVRAGQAVVAGSVVDLAISAATHGFGREPFEIRVLEDGVPRRVLQVTPLGDGAVIRRLVQVSPNPDAATVFTVEIPLAPDELVPGNNSRSVLVPPPGRPRRILLVEGAPGYEHSFLKRALSDDRGLSVDAAIHKGQNDRGERTFYIQAASDRARALAEGYPGTRAALFAYDAVILANIDTALLRPGQVERTVAFVSERGGGLLVMGARSFDGRGLRDMGLDRLLPLLVTARPGAGLVRVTEAPGTAHRIALTPAGETHPIMRLADEVDETRRRWAGTPALGNVMALGPARPGAEVLATARGADAASAPVVAVQRFGPGRTMVFAGEASWRWKMLAPAADRTYDRFWRQAVRWLAAGAPDPVMVRVEGGWAEGDPLRADVVVSDSAFAPSFDADVRVQVDGPRGGRRDLRAVPVVGEPGRYVVDIPAQARGVYTLTATAVTGDGVPRRAEASALVGGADLELTDPRRQDPLLQRLADNSGGRFREASEVEYLVADLRTDGATAPPVARDLWHTVWAFALIVTVVSTEWVLRRRWGLR